MSGASQTGTTSSSGQNLAVIPSFLRPYFTNTANGLINAQKNLPSLSQLYGQIPLQGTAGLNSGQLSDIMGFQNAAMGGNNFATGLGQQGLGNFVTTPGSSGPSPATQAEIKSFDTLQAPLIDSQAGLSGLGNSGAMLSALAQGQESALVPFLQADAQNQLTASSQLGQLGQQEAQTQQNQLQGALSANTLPQTNTQDQLNALYNQAQQKLGFASQIQGGGQADFPALLGSNSTGGSSSAAPKF